MIWVESTAILAAVAVNLFTAGVPLAALTVLALEMARRASPRARYAIAIGGFWLAALLPFVAVGCCLVARVGGSEGVSSDPTIGVATWLGEVPFWMLSGTVIVWGIIAAAGLGREIVRHHSLWRTRRRWRSVPGAVIEARGLQRRVRLMTGSGGVPVTVGWLRPVVYLPSWAWRLDDRELRALFAHEAEHSRWLDPLVHLLSRLMLEALWPAWHLRLLYRTVRLEREAAADQAAVKALGHGPDTPAVSWADLLLKVARPAGEPAVGAGNNLESRLRRLLDGLPALQPWRTGARIVAAMGLLVATVWGGIVAPSAFTAPLAAATEAHRGGWMAFENLAGESPVVDVVDQRRRVIERRVVKQQQIVRVRPDPPEE